MPYLAACALHGRGFEEAANLRRGFLQAKLLNEARTEHQVKLLKP